MNTEAKGKVDNSTELFRQKQAEMSDEQLIELAKKQVSELARTGGRSHKMCVPPMVTDTDMLFSELIRRFKERRDGNPVADTGANAINTLLCTGLNDAAKSIHKDAKRKGFWDSERETGTLLMLCVSELSEALEADRKGRVANLDKFDQGIAHGDIFETYIKDTFEDELADTVIRILDLCGARGIDLERHINLKLKYNRSRERMHGKAY